MFGPSVAGLKGWTTQTKARGFLIDRVSIPNEFYQLNKFVPIAADVMFVLGMPFLTLIRRRLSSLLWNVFLDVLLSSYLS